MRVGGEFFCCGIGYVRLEINFKIIEKSIEIGKFLKWDL